MFCFSTVLLLVSLDVRTRSLLDFVLRHDYCFHYFLLLEYSSEYLFVLIRTKEEAIRFALDHFKLKKSH